MGGEKEDKEDRGSISLGWRKICDQAGERLICIWKQRCSDL